MNKFFVLVGLFITSFFNTQVLYDDNIKGYEGGSEQFYADLNDALVKNGFEKYNNRMSEMFVAKVEIIEGIARINNKNILDDCATQWFIKGFNNINKSKKWRYADGNLNKFSITFYPIDYGKNFMKGYTPEKLIKNAEFPGGTIAFRNALFEKLRNQNINLKDLQIVVNFTINKEGDLNNIIVEKPQNLGLDLKSKIIQSIEQINTKWKPQSFRNIPVSSRFRIPITFKG